MKKLAEYTLHELQVLPVKAADKSIFSLLDQTSTDRGRDRLKILIDTPPENLRYIEDRQQLFQFISEHLDQVNISISRAYEVAAQGHLGSSIAWYSDKSLLRLYRRVLWMNWFHLHDLNKLQSGIKALQLVLRTIDRRTVSWRNNNQIPDLLQDSAQILRSFFDHHQIQKALSASNSQSFLLRADFTLRRKYIDEVRSVFEIYYELDAYCGIARFLKTVSWTYPEFVQSQEPTFEVLSMKHPLLSEDFATGNDFSLTSPCNLTLLTGGNMSGKTTFLKSCGLVVYLAHLGLPTPASYVRLSFFDCLLTSIHLSDNLDLGYSHFYSELMRIKSLAEALSDGQKVFLIIDELFRGTNPNDALQCACKLLDKIIPQTKSLFIISSHLPEIAAFYTANNKIQFNCFKTIVSDGVLKFTHKIEGGIVGEHTGLLLLEQTGALKALL